MIFLKILYSPPVRITNLRKDGKEGRQGRASLMVNFHAPGISA